MLIGQTIDLHMIRMYYRDSLQTGLFCIEVLVFIGIYAS